MDFKNFIGTGVGALKGNLLGKRIPLNVMLSVTNRCPSRCSYCDIPRRGETELSIDEIYGLIDELCELGCQRLGLWGGEPLMRDDIGDIVDYAKGKGLFVTLDSNGYLLPKKIEDIKNLDHLVLALDGDEQTHDLNRERGSFKKVSAAIKAVKGKIPFWTITVLTKNNLGSIGFILDKAKREGFLTTFQVLHHNESLSRNHDDLLPADEEYKKAVKTLISEKKKGAPIASSGRYLNYLLRWPDYKKTTYANEIGHLRCWAGRLYCNVDTDGSVYPCSLLIGKEDAPNFLETGFKAAFRSLGPHQCRACLASCFTEYNYLYSLDLTTIAEWHRAIRKTKRDVCRTKR